MHALDGVYYISVRDAHSEKLLKDIGVSERIRVLTDPAILLGEPVIKPERKKAAVCVRHWFDRGNFITDEKANSNMMNSLADALDKMIETHGLDIDFIPMRVSDPDDDTKAAKSIAGLLKNKKRIKIIRTPPTVDEFIEMLGDYYLLIGMRLHSLILAVGCGVPVIGLSYMPKVEAFLKSVGNADYCIDLKKIKPEIIIDMVDESIKNRDVRSSRLLKKTGELKVMAKKNIKELIDLARGGKA